MFSLHGWLYSKTPQWYQKYFARIIIATAALIALLFLAGVAHASTSGIYPRFNVRLQYHYQQYPDGAVQASRSTQIYSHHGWKSTSSAGYLAITPHSVKLHLAKSEKVFYAYADYTMNGRPYQMVWDTSKPLPSSFFSATGGRETLTRVFVAAVIPYHPPYYIVHLM